MVLPGGPFQISLIRKLRARNCYVVCADRSADCPGAREADKYYQIGLDERGRLLDLAQAIKPRGIVTNQTDTAVVIVAWLSGMMGLRSIGEASAALFTNKYMMREFGRLHGFPTPAYYLCSDVEESETAASKIGYPVVIKPIDSQASKGVCRVENVEELKTHYTEAAGYSTNGAVLVEEYITGEEFTVEGFMASGKHCTLGISEKCNYSKSVMITRSLRYVPESAKCDYAKLEQAHDSWMDLTQLSFGITHAEYIYSNGRYYLVEVAARGGGSGISSEIVPWISGVDCESLLLDAVLDGVIRRPKKIHSSRCALLEFYRLPSGMVQSVNGVARAKGFPGVVDVVVHQAPGTVTRELTDATNRAGYFILRASDEAELSRLRDLVLETVRVKFQ